jgi:hypothetical protein
MSGIKNEVYIYIYIYFVNFNQVYVYMFILLWKGYRDIDQKINRYTSTSIIVIKIKESYSNLFNI